MDPIGLVVVGLCAVVALLVYSNLKRKAAGRIVDPDARYLLLYNLIPTIDDDAAHIIANGGAAELGTIHGIVKAMLHFEDDIDGRRIVAQRALNTSPDFHVRLYLWLEVASHDELVALKNFMGRY